MVFQIVLTKKFNIDNKNYPKEVKNFCESFLKFVRYLNFFYSFLFKKLDFYMLFLLKCVNCTYPKSKQLSRQNGKFFFKENVSFKLFIKTFTKYEIF